MITFIICPEEIALNSGQAQPEEFGEDIILDSQRNKSKESGEAWLGVLMNSVNGEMVRQIEGGPGLGKDITECFAQGFGTDLVRTVTVAGE
ncbi:hypothetical protein RirG_110610 [Rhizophagus irregularis DAOM 197198w]|uniref:Uncharacterized protein n=1 Tax=Rhizophagus irregularis (strain DAOM 197198w) TaxID=1432141 RepID=A0A015JEE4_RHIIW|nr:hypothetical protein RirG_110610 [Rhizophagus irregularis DAOM 197198w]